MGRGSQSKPAEQRAFQEMSAWRGRLFGLIKRFSHRDSFREEENETQMGNIVTIVILQKTVQQIAFPLIEGLETCACDHSLQEDFSMLRSDVNLLTLELIRSKRPKWLRT